MFIFKKDFLICFEMLLAAIAHLFAFSHKPFVDLAAVNDPCCYSFMRILDLSDERTDINDHFRQIGLFSISLLINFLIYNIF